MNAFNKWLKQNKVSCTYIAALIFILTEAEYELTEGFNKLKSAQWWWTNKELVTDKTVTEAQEEASRELCC